MLVTGQTVVEIVVTSVSVTAPGVVAVTGATGYKLVKVT